MNTAKVQVPDHIARWVAGLSNGEIAVEGNGKFEELPGELSPWQKLQKYLQDNNLEITSLKIQIRGRSYNLPSNSPRFGGEIPVKYNYFRKIVGDLSMTLANVEVVERYICIEAIYDKYKIQLWVDETFKDEAWISVINL
jgi:hypothetical protein